MVQSKLVELLHPKISPDDRETIRKWFRRVDAIFKLAQWMFFLAVLIAIYLKGQPSDETLRPGPLWALIVGLGLLLFLMVNGLYKF